ncbi:hypothetical protein NDN08_004775 [Rhodosorus marinus]|uniref:TAP42-like family protein n=1 Tax=Rhodosorus marinus TaxID=101924 RepID=A0AAV8UQ13_9RHOD|nr:hypothetical protein NDN08_004775 [Rhodosorus marinus]
MSLSSRFYAASSSLKKYDASVPVIGEETCEVVELSMLSDEISAQWSEAVASGCISRSETLEDMATKDVKFALLPFYEARALCLSIPGEIAPPADRVRSLEDAKNWYTLFFDLLSTLEILSRAELESLSKELPRNPSERRTRLIEKLKREKEESAKLEDLKRKSRSADPEMAEEIEREVSVSVLKAAAREASNSRSSLDEEIQLLKYAVDTKAKGKDPADEARKLRENMPPPESYRIMDTRKYQQDQVFKPSHNLPTYTVEEWGEIELARMREQMKIDAEKEKLKAEESDEDSDRDEVSDKKTMKERAWADWTDDNNKGSGNTIR